MSSRPGADDMRPASEIAKALWDRFLFLDARLTKNLRRISLPLIRVSLAVVFLWFGFLKIFDVSPAADLVSRTVYWVDASWFVPFLGVVEVVIGFALLVGRGLRLVLPVFAAQMLGTLLVLVVLPEVAFRQGNPLLLTIEGEFVLKNLVLLSAGLAVGAQVRRPRPWSAGAGDARDP
jgi:putative oxidoreductase